MTNLEDKIIAYLDGTLDEQSRAELLHTLSVSPEKRKLLEEHIKLREIISLGHKPQSVPLVTERKLADRIPVLMQELPYLAEKSTRVAAPLIGVNQTSYFTLLSRSVSNFFSSRLAPAVSLGTLALLGGLTWYMVASNDARDQAAPSVANTPAASQSATPQPKVATRQSEVAANDVARQDLALTNRVTTQTGTNATNLARPDYIKDGIRYIWSNGNYHPVPVPEALNEPGLPDFGDLNGSPRDNGDPKLQDRANADIPNLMANADERSKSTEDTSSSNLAQSDPSAESIRDPQHQTSPPMRSTVTGRIIVEADAGIGATMRPNPKSQQYEAGSTELTLPSVSIGYEFPSGIGVALEGGQNVFSQHQQQLIESKPSGNPAPVGSPISVNRRREYTASVVDIDAMWTQAVVRVPLYKKLEASAGAGAAFVDGVSPMVSLGLGATVDLGESVAVVLGGAMRGAWLPGLEGERSADNTPINAGEAIGVTYTARTEEVFSSSLTFRVGLRVSPF